MAIKRCIIEQVKLDNLADYMHQHRLRVVRLEHWDKRGLVLVTDKDDAKVS